jgi:hypothetical protein
MGLKGYRLWVMGQLDPTCSAPASSNMRKEVMAEASLRTRSPAANATPFTQSQGGHSSPRYQGLGFRVTHHHVIRV